MTFEGIELWKLELLLLVFVVLMYVLLRVLFARGGRATSRVPELVLAVLGASALIGGYYFWLYYLVQWE